MIKDSAGCLWSAQVFGSQIKLDNTLLYQHFASKFNRMLNFALTVGQQKFIYVAMVLDNWQEYSLSLSNTLALTHESETSVCVYITLLLSSFLIMRIANGFSIVINWQGE